MDRRGEMILVVLFCTICACTCGADNGWRIMVRADADDSLYKIGEEATFTVRPTAPDLDYSQATLYYELTNDGWLSLEKGTLAFDEGIATITGTLDEPGFLRCDVSYLIDGEILSSTRASAGFEPEKIQPSLPPPDDFDSFWDQKKKQLAQIPLNARMMPMDSPRDDVHCFEVKVQCLGGKPVSGYYARPSRLDPATGQMHDRKYPALLFVHGAGVRSANLNSILKPAGMGILVLDINAHGLGNGHPESYYRELAENSLKGYPHFGKNDREESYFLGMFLRVIRGVDFLASQPEWDGEIIVVRGSSQGGAQAIAAAGLDSRVTHITASVPGLCDHTSKINGWPRFVDMNSDESPDESILETVRYFDMTNFARRAKARAIFSVGFIDNTCRPTGIYAMYNVYGGRKKIINEPLMAHEYPARIHAAFTDWMNFALFD